MKKTPEMRRRETKRKVHQERLEALQRLMNAGRTFGIAALNVGEAFKRAKKDMIKITKQIEKHYASLKK